MIQTKAQGQLEPITKEKKYWWHWIITKHPDYAQGQMPIRDEIGEDCNLFNKIDEMRHEKDKDDKTIITYRHALADWNVITLEDGTMIIRPLLPDQEIGEFLTMPEYDKKRSGLMLKV